MSAAFGARVRELRIQRSMRLRDCAKRSGMSPSHLSDIELGNRGPPKPARIMDLAEALAGGSRLFTGAQAKELAEELEALAEEDVMDRAVEAWRR